MRPIEFRGLTIDTKEMVFGDLIHGVGAKSGKAYILPNDTNFAYVKTKAKPHDLDGYEVLPETVGQLVGIFNGVKIFEGDKIQYSHDEDEYQGIIQNLSCFGVSVLITSRGFINNSGDFVDNSKGWFHNKKVYHEIISCHEKQVIGNIHETKEGGNNG
jgi:uncharacterized phage protein (TIGR01671 family)